MSHLQIPSRMQFSKLCHWKMPLPCVASRRQCVGFRKTYATAAESDKFTITTPLYYANAEPHMGGAYSTIAADVLARYQRLQGKKVTFVTGTDEHGEKIALSAEKAGLTPQEHCDRIAELYKQLWLQLNISHDRFIRTTNSSHEAVVKALLAAVWAKGDIRKAAYSGRYCIACEEYKDPGDLDEDGNCLVHRSPCPERSEENYFFKLSNYTKQVQEHCASPGAVQPQRARNEVLAWIEDGCRDFSITRSTVDWGIRVPEDESQTVYVWFDALIGYLSALLLPDSSEASVAKVPDASVEKLLECGWPADVQVIGKDILRFHAVYWPGMLMSMGLPPPKKTFGHGFLTKDGLKMGKSLGNVLDPFKLVDTYGCDAVRFYFMKEVVFGQDGDFSEARFRFTVNAHLANDIGNLTNRCLNLLKKNCESSYPVAASEVPSSHPFRTIAAESIGAARTAYEDLAMHDAISSVLAITGRANQLLEETAPWTALKKGNEEQKAAAQVTLVAALEATRIAAVALSPVVPQLAQRILTQLGLDADVQTLDWGQATAWGGLQQGVVFPKPQPVFKRIEEEAPSVAVAA